jgi:nitroreductase
MPAEIGTGGVRALKRVRQIRDFRPDPVPNHLVDEILDVARWTGSASNRQPWRFIVIRDSETRRRIAEIGAPSTTHVGKAPLALAVVMDGDSEVRNAYDEGRVSERILIAAEMLGLGAGIAWVKAKFRPQIHELLGVSEPQFVRTIVSIGYPTDAAKRPKSAPGTARRPLPELVHEERLT